jgi:hypothetical protein
LPVFVKEGGLSGKYPWEKTNVILFSGNSKALVDLPFLSSGYDIRLSPDIKEEIKFVYAFGFKKYKRV